MAIVNVDLSEYDSLRNRKSELELRVKQLEEELKHAKDATKVLVRTKTRTIWKNTSIFDRDKIYDIGGESESYVNFEDVRLKVEEHFKKEIERSIKENMDSAASYRKKENELQKKFDEKIEEYESESRRALEHEREISNNLLRKMKSCKNDIMNVVRKLDSKFVCHKKEIVELKDIANYLYI